MGARWIDRYASIRWIDRALIKWMPYYPDISDETIADRITIYFTGFNTADITFETMDAGNVNMTGFNPADIDIEVEH